MFHKQLWQHQPQPSKKKDHVKNESKLKAFIKRSSEPLLHGSTPQNQQQVRLMLKVDVIKSIVKLILYDALYEYFYPF